MKEIQSKKNTFIKEASEPLTDSMKEKWQQRFWKKHRTIQ